MYSHAPPHEATVVLHAGSGHANLLPLRSQAGCPAPPPDTMRCNGAHASSGIRPLNWLPPSPSCTSELSWPSSLGTLPTRWLCSRSRSCNFERRPTEEGNVPVRLLKSSARIFTRPSRSHPTSSQSQMWCSADSQFRWRTQYLLEHAVPSSMRASRSREAQLARDKNKESIWQVKSSQVKSGQVKLDLTKLDSRGQLVDRGSKQASKRTHEEFTRRESSQDSSQVCKKNQTTKGSLSNVLRKPAVVESV